MFWLGKWFAFRRDGWCGCIDAETAAVTLASCLEWPCCLTRADLSSPPVLSQLWPGLPPASGLLQRGACGEWKLWVQPSVFVQLPRDAARELHALWPGAVPAASGVEGWNLGAGECAPQNLHSSAFHPVPGPKKMLLRLGVQRAILFFLTNQTQSTNLFTSTLICW